MRWEEETWLMVMGLMMETHRGRYRFPTWAKIPCELLDVDDDHDFPYSQSWSLFAMVKSRHGYRQADVFDQILFSSFFRSDPTTSSPHSP